MQLKRFAFGLGIILGAGALASCGAPAPEPTPAPEPAPTPPPAAAPVTAPEPGPAPPPVITDRMDDWQDRALTLGDWRYLAETGETLAIFAADPLSREPQLIIACNLETREVGIVRPSEAGVPVDMFIRTETADRMLSATPFDGRQPIVVGKVDALDRLLDAMAFSNGRIAVLVGGEAPLIVPAWPEITRVVEDCRV